MTQPKFYFNHLKLKYFLKTNKKISRDAAAYEWMLHVLPKKRHAAITNET